MAMLISNKVNPVLLGSRILGKGVLKSGMPVYKYIFNEMLTLPAPVCANREPVAVISSNRVPIVDFLMGWVK